MALHSSTISLSSLNIEFLLCCVQSFFSTAWFQICIIYVAPFAHSFNDTICIRMTKCDSPYQREERTPFLKKHRMSKGIRALNLKNVFAFCVKRPFVREILIKVKHISGRYSNFLLSMCVFFWRCWVAFVLCSVMIAFSSGLNGFKWVFIGTEWFAMNEWKLTKAHFRYAINRHCKL